MARAPPGPFPFPAFRGPMMPDSNESECYCILHAVCKERTDMDGSGSVKAEEQRQGEELLRNILDILPVGLFLIDAKGEITRANSAALQIWDGAKLVGKGDWTEYKAW